MVGRAGKNNIMVIEPNSIIYLWSGIPLDNTYTDSIYFASRQAQYNYFSGRTPVKTFRQNTYQRVNSGVFRAPCKADDIYNVNYMTFQNTSYGDKWFFAFVTAVEYDNNATCFVYYEIDVIQTYLLDCTLKSCFIERQHTVTDIAGDNILPEPVAVGEYRFENYDKITTGLDDMAILIGVCDVAGNSQGKLYDNAYGGMKIMVFPARNSAIDDINSYLDSYIQRPESIVVMYMCPVFALMVEGGIQGIPDSGYSLTNNKTGATGGFGLGEVGRDVTATFGSYLPKNKKLYTYPYQFLHIDDGDGSELNLRYEFFANPATPSVTIQASVTSPVQLKLFPEYYRGGTAGHPVKAEFLTLSGFPICSWNYDTYRAWVAQNSIPIALGVGAAALGIIATVATGGLALPAAVAGVGLAANTVSQAYTASQQADTCKGNVSGGNVNFAHQCQTFYRARARITRDHARMIDNFFTMYGYAIKAVAVPNIHARPYWTYVKTADCKIIGNCPVSDIRILCECFNKGITFWTLANNSTVGDYSLDNSPV